MNFKALRDHFKREMAIVEESQEAESLFYIVVEHVSGFCRSKVLLDLERTLRSDELQLYKDIVSQLQQGKPIQYILGEAHFYGLKFHVSPAVLIPRAETEELVDWIRDTAKLGPNKGTLLDIGTGSGCIAVSLAKHLPYWDVFALDVSAAALTVAGENAAANEVQLSFIEADVLNYSSLQMFNVIVSNPPYVKEDEREAMHANVLDHEPHTALFVSNHNPLIFYKAIADLAISNLVADGFLFFEINEYLGVETVDMLESKGFSNIILKKDMQGKDRMIRCQR